MESKRIDDMTRGEKVISFIESYCKVPEGDLLGQKFHLLPFQKKFIIDVYDNPNKTKLAILSIARKQGKTALIACLVLVHLIGPEAVRNSQIISGAQSRDQAAIVFDLCCKIIRQNEQLSVRIKISPSNRRLYGITTNTMYKAISAEAKTAHGGSPILAILDEVGQVKGPRSLFIEAITTSQGAYKNPLLITISTQAPTDNDLLSTWIDGELVSHNPKTVCHVYSAPEDMQIDDREGWSLANPAMGVFRSLEDIEEQCEKAKKLPGSEPSFRNLILNQRVETSAPFVSKIVWESCGNKPKPLEKITKVWCGLDLSAVSDLTAFVAVDEDCGMHSYFWLPEFGLADKSLSDHVPYDVWAKQGYLMTTPGKAIEYSYVAEWLFDFFGTCDVQKVAFDRWNYKHLKPWLLKAGFTEDQLTKFIEFGQGGVSMTPALREFEVKLLTSKIAHGKHPVLNMCRHNCVVKGFNESRKFDKRVAKGRIDGMVAAAMAIGVMPVEDAYKPSYQIMSFG